MDKEENFDFLSKLKEKIEKLTKRQQVLLYNECLKKKDSLKFTINKNGIFFDIKDLYIDTAKCILEYILKLENQVSSSL